MSGIPRHYARFFFFFLRYLDDSIHKSHASPPVSLVPVPERHATVSPSRFEALRFASARRRSHKSDVT